VTLAAENSGAGDSWLDGYGREEEELVAALPDSPRLRRLLKDLETIMMSEGFLHLSTDDLARRLHCSKATLYRLAGSREELFELVVRRWLARLRDDGYKHLIAAEGWPAKLIAFLHVVKSGTKDASYRYMEDLRSFPGGYRILMDHQKRRIDVVEGIIAGGLAAGDFEGVHPRLAAELILTSVRRAVEPDFLQAVGLTLSEAFDEWYRILEYGLIKRSGKRRKP
jgi:AcrR family transcriptional regulator